MVGTVKTGIQGLSRLPFGSLLLIASHRRKWRDKTLMDAAIYGAFDARARFLALSELVGLPERRYHDRVSVLCDQWASEAALEACGTAPRDDSEFVSVRRAFELAHTSHRHDVSAEIQAARQKYERDSTAWTSKHNRTKNEALARFQKRAKAFGVGFQSVQTPTLELVLEQIGRVPAGCVVVSMTWRRFEKGVAQSGSLRLCGDHARALKDEALRHGVLLMLGMATTEVRDKRADKERPLTLEDFAAYGFPDAAADAVVTSVPAFSERGRTAADRILASRY